MDQKRSRGRFYTIGNPFDCEPFQTWAQLAQLPQATVLEPYAGCNALIDHLSDMGLLNRFQSYDIEPASNPVQKQDTIADFPTGFDVCITNPPWLAKNVARRLRMPFPTTPHDDLYQLALELCLKNCAYVAALVPESFIRSGLFKERLHSFVSLRKFIFKDTQHPVGLALFLPQRVKDTHLWSGKEALGSLNDLLHQRPPEAKATEGIRFNAVDGNIGLRALDNTKGPSIRFCDVSELKDYKVRPTCRSITKIRIPWRVSIARCNAYLHSFRIATQDVLLTPYRGLRQDGMYRRRLDWALARDILVYVR